MKTAVEQEIFEGEGAYKDLETVLGYIAPRKVFLVTGKGSYMTSTAQVRIGPIISKYPYVQFNDFNINPQAEEVEKALNLFQQEQCDVVVGVGGGSVMDLAKSVSLLAGQEGKLENIQEAALKARSVPSIMVPTTAGSGSESSKYAVINIGKAKFSITHESLVPDVAILDPLFLVNCPSYVAACSGIDALCQAIEAFWSVNSTEESREYSRRAVPLIIQNIVAAVGKKDIAAIEQMLKGSNLAGKAISIAQTTMAHAASYPMTSYFGVAHGHAVALTLPELLMLNNQVSEQNCNDPRGSVYVRNAMAELNELLGQETAQDSKGFLISLMKKLGLKTTLSSLNISGSDIDVIVEHGFSPQRAKNNPRKITEKDLKQLLLNIR